MKYAFIEEHVKQWPIRLMCKVLECNHNAYYRWIKTRKRQGTSYENYLLFKIKEAFDMNRQTYGSRRIYQTLKSWGVTCYQNQIAKIMRDNGLRAKTKRKFKHTTDSNHKKEVAPNLLERKFSADKRDQVWVGDITYVWTREGWSYLATLLDLYSRKIVGWSISKRMTKGLVIKSLTDAVKMRKPDAGLIVHTDRGSQYASDEYKAVLKAIGAQQSMSRKGDCWDNAVAESFFKTIKYELIHWHNFRTREEAELRIFEYIELFYNRYRLHSANNYMSPNNFENQELS